MAPRLYVDMDGVLVDFASGAETYFKMSVGTSHFTAVWEGPKGWRQLMKDWPTFWMDLDPEPGFDAVWKVVRLHHPAILTAIPQGWSSSAVGKRIWCTRHLPNWGHHPHEEFHAVDRPQKRQYATQKDGTPNILIDDFTKNIAEWTNAGGQGLLYTGPNSILNIARDLAAWMPK